MQIRVVILELQSGLVDNILEEWVQIVCSVYCIHSTTTAILQPSIWNYPGAPVPEETFTDSHLS